MPANFCAIDRGLIGEPAFHDFWFHDYNRLGGTKKKRWLQAPNRPMRVVQRNLIRYVRMLKLPMPSVTACVPGWSPKRNAQLHGGNQYLFQTDLQNAYQAVDFTELAAILCQLSKELVGNEKMVEAFFRRYCSSPLGGLAVGANSSPLLFNLYGEVKLDRSLRTYCESRSIQYTRYLDDLTFSSRDRTIGKRRRSDICRLIEQAGFTINHGKTRVIDLEEAGVAKITGVLLDINGHTFLMASWLRRLHDGLLRLDADHQLTMSSKLNGLVGLFYSVTDTDNPTLKEQEIMRLILSYRYRQKRRNADR